jgi:hypothetical protein
MWSIQIFATEQIKFFFNVGVRTAKQFWQFSNQIFPQLFIFNYIWITESFAKILTKLRWDSSNSSFKKIAQYTIFRFSMIEDRILKKILIKSGWQFQQFCNFTLFWANFWGEPEFQSIHVWIFLNNKKIFFYFWIYQHFWIICWVKHCIFLNFSTLFWVFQHFSEYLHFSEIIQFFLHFSEFF